MVWPALPKRVQYALQALTCLARAQSPVRAHELAECAGIPPTQAAKILYLLTWGGFVSSRRGSQGGFWLRIPADSIRVRDVTEFFHPPRDGKDKPSDDPILQLWHELAASSYRTFEELTLAELMAGRPPQPLLGPEDNWPFCP